MKIESRQNSSDCLPPRAIDIFPPQWGRKYYSPYVDLMLTQTREGKIEFAASSNFILVLLTPQARRKTMLSSSRRQEYSASPGTVELVPAGENYTAEWSEPKENILLSVTPEKLNNLSIREYDLELSDPPLFKVGDVDPIAHKIAMLLRNGIINDGDNHLYLESLSMALLSHLIRRMTNADNRVDHNPKRGGLASHIRRRVVEHIHENIHRRITISELSDISGMSCGHFSRSFGVEMGVSPHQYVMKLRAERAMSSIANTDSHISQIANAHGFSSQSHMMVVMKKFFGTTPGELRRKR
ncbi:helix-turn-helix transcriptional regulator [Paracoccus methylovorus]|uniref:Transcriptional regulator, AraC family n=2 Tax=Paracoccus TaxID=265 RepID=A1B6M6_PARDP|nr:MULTISPECIES: AraC family transcriptional regulator [Paracoccus]ABL71170.1 transcriptional regulator, AraC family [Paracoccus denitrificans PD1222]MBB4628225.1 AraC family transcriptional regulator [Paracoccus denitrificans]MCU7429289.1 AraC family transcriptional regulator [Paracoccus denitrificans]QAR27815.1 AraC family transcriptional regulator [Paracoccus denitrificans]QRZ15698.1 helix-turn-helix transcriptional regulator [Paracoccus methylovorus]